MTNFTDLLADLSVEERLAVQNYAKQAVTRDMSYGPSTRDQSKAFWAWARHVKTRDEEKGAVCQFPRWSFLMRAEQEQEQHRKNIWLKPRQMMISNLNCAKRLFRASRCDLGREEAYLGLIVSMGEREALELMRRIWFMYESLPDFLREPVAKRTESELVFEKGGRLICLPASSRIGHSYTATDIFLDEWARLPYDREMHTGLMPTIGMHGTVDGVSTPNGRFNVFAEIWHQPDSGWNKIELDWREHPLRDARWREQEIRKVCPDYPHDTAIWDQQYEKRFEVFTDKKVYPGFTDDHVFHLRSPKYPEGLDFNMDETLYRGWDFGGHVAAVTFFQVIRKQIIILRELIVTDHLVSRAESVVVDPDNNIDDLAGRVLDVTNSWFKGYTRVRDFCDPQGAHVSDMSARSQRSRIDVLNTYGIYPEFRPSNIMEGVEIIRMRLRERPDGTYGLIISKEGCPVLIDGLRGGISRKPAPPNQPFSSQGEEVKKDGWFEHIHDSLRYAMVGIFRTAERKRPTPNRRRSVRYHPVTGVPQ